MQEGGEIPFFLKYPCALEQSNPSLNSKYIEGELPATLLCRLSAMPSSLLFLSISTTNNDTLLTILLLPKYNIITPERVFFRSRFAVAIVIPFTVVVVEKPPLLPDEFEEEEFEEEAIVADELPNEKVAGL